MANKRINDLTLRSNFDSTCNVAVDDSTQSYRVTGAQLSTFAKAEVIVPGLISDRTADTDPQSVDAIMTWDSSATALKKVTKANFQKRRIVAKTSTYSAGPEDDIITVSAGSDWTLGLPTAVGIEGKEYWILRTDADLTKKVTIDPNSSETIGGSATLLMYSQGEMIHCISDGANWQVLERVIPSKISAYTPTFAAFGTPTGVFGSWQRIGDEIELKVDCTAGTATSASISFTLPTGLTIDFTKLSTRSILGYGDRNLNGSQFAAVAEGPWPIFSDGSDTTHLFVAGQSSVATAFAKQIGTTNVGTAGGFTAVCRVPIVEFAL